MVPGFTAAMHLRAFSRALVTAFLSDRELGPVMRVSHTVHWLIRGTAELEDFYDNRKESHKAALAESLRELDEIEESHRVEAAARNRIDSMDAEDGSSMSARNGSVSSASS